MCEGRRSSGGAPHQQECGDCGEVVHSWSDTVDYKDWKLTEHGWSSDTIVKNRHPRIAKCIADCIAILRGDRVTGKIETPEVISALESTLAVLCNAGRANQQHSLFNCPTTWDPLLSVGAAAQIFRMRAERTEGSINGDKGLAKYFRSMASHNQKILDDFVKLVARQNPSTSSGGGRRRG